MSLVLQDPLVVAPSPTPFHNDDTVDHAAIEANVARWLETPLSGFVLNTENGEEAFLAESERLEIVRTVARVAAGKTLLIGGIDNPSVTESLRIAETLVEAGAELIRVRIPRLTANVRGYFEQLVPHAPAPVIVIHQPAPGLFLSGASALGIEPELIGELVAMDGVFGYIASADLRIEARVRLFVPETKRFWAGNGTLLLPGIVQGANGACLMLGNVAPAECLELFRLTAAGELAEAAALQRRLVEADWQILSRRAAGLKAALELLGYQAGRPRSPQMPCSPAELEQIRAALHRAGLIGKHGNT
ncbi:MAG: dihydrodipicolinate synthase family protein [Candidatus Paceibacterota bacterium]